MNEILKVQSQELVTTIKNQLDTLLAYERRAPLIEIDIVKRNLQTLYDLVDSMSEDVGFLPEEEPKVTTIDDEIEELLEVAEDQFAGDGIDIDMIKVQEEVFDEQEQEEEELLDEEIIQVLDKPIEESSIGGDANEKENIENTAREEKTEETRVEQTPEKKPKDKKLVEAKKKEKKKKDKSAKKSNEKIVYVLDVEPEEEDIEKPAVVENSMSDKLRRKPIKSLKTGIGINDKFMIINDLFEGRAKEYNAAIKILDAQENRIQAIYLLEDMRDEHLWENSDPAFAQLKTYVERRYQ